MAEQAAAGFGGLLRQLRADAGLTQEELAEAARLSPRTVSDLERGISRTARKDSAVLLADALGLAGRARGVFVAAAQGRVQAAEVLAARAAAPGAFAGNLPVPLSSFVGRAGELAELATAMARQHAHGTRLLPGITLEVAAVVLARLGQAEPAAVLAGAFSAHFPPDISPVPKDQRLGIGEAQALARHALGEAAYSAAFDRGAAMGEEEVVGYVQGEYRRLASLRAEPGAPAPESPPGPGAAGPPGMTVLPGKATCRSTAGAAGQHGHSGPRGTPPARQAHAALAAASAAGQHWRSEVLLTRQRCQLHTIATRS